MQGWILVTTSCLCTQEGGKDVLKRQFRFNYLNNDPLGVVNDLVSTYLEMRYSWIRNIYHVLNRTAHVKGRENSFCQKNTTQ